MTTTAERAGLLAEHCEKLTSSKFLGKFSAQDLLDWIELELGNVVVLDDFVPFGAGGKISKAIANGPILHILVCAISPLFTEKSRKMSPEHSKTLSKIQNWR